MAYVLAAVGGALGALGRWGIAERLPSSPAGWPWATLVVNLAGCFLLGLLTASLATRLPDAAWLRPFLAVGVLGGFTTYSTFAVETVELVRGGTAVLAAGYLVASVLGGVLAVAAGVGLGRASTGRRTR